MQMRGEVRKQSGLSSIPIYPLFMSRQDVASTQLERYSLIRTHFGIRVPAPATLSYRDRSNLVAQNPYTDNSRTSVSPAPSGRTTPSGIRYADDLEGQNDEALEGLTAKVKLLKFKPVSEGKIQWKGEGVDQL